VKRAVIYGLIVVLVASGTGANAYLLQASYRAYRAAAAAPVALSLSAKSAVANAKQKTVGSRKQGELADTGLYKYEERDHSKIEAGDTNAQLVIASDEALGANYVLADTSDGTLGTNKFTTDWTLQTINKDAMWAPGACASKPTYFLQKHYIFIDDGKTLPTDKYNSYVVFDLLTQKFRYFGGDNFTDRQARQEKILSVVDENDQIVFYLDQSDDQGPLANSSSFKHARSDAPGYITRRVIDLATLHYTDYHLKFTLPQNPAFNYYYVNIDSGVDNLITISSDSTTDYYAGTVANNAIVLTPASASAQPPDETASPTDPLAAALDPLLAKALPAFLSSDGSNAEQGSPRFEITTLGSQGSVQYLVATSRQNDYSTPVVYDASTSTVSPMTTQAVFDFTSYVPLWVF
jgi:hypothetical protein